MVGTPATAFVTVINGGPVTALDVGIALDPSVPVTFDYQVTDPRTNVPIGAVNTPADIPPGASQSYVISLRPDAAFSPIDLTFRMSGVNADAAPVFVGTNTLLMSASSTRGPDLVALGLTPSGDGIVNIGGTTGIGIFSVVTVSLKKKAVLTATADTGGANLPVVLSVCQTNPVSGACMNPIVPGPSATLQTDALDTPTFAVFVQGAGDILFSPATSRLFLRFKTASGATVGSTSAALRTQ